MIVTQNFQETLEHCHPTFHAPTLTPAHIHFLYPDPSIR